MEFRPIRRTKNAISEEAAKALLKQERRAVLAVNGENGYPYAIPVNYEYDMENGKIYFHGAKQGHKFEMIGKDERVCFTVYGNEHFKEGQWAPYVQSTVVFGRCKALETTPEALDCLRFVARKYYPTEDEIEKEIAAAAARVQVYEITIEHISGKQIQEK